MVEVTQLIENNQKIVCVRVCFYSGRLKKISNPREILNFADVFLKHNVKKLLPNCDIDLAKKLEPGTKLFYCLIYKFLGLKLEKLRLYLEEKLTLKFIEVSKLPARIFILFVMNKKRS